jgi:hypothetical protein
MCQHKWDGMNLVSSGAVKKAVGHFYSLITCSHRKGKKVEPKALNEAPQATTSCMQRSLVNYYRWRLRTSFQENNATSHLPALGFVFNPECRLRCFRENNDEAFFPCGMPW